MGWRTTRDAPAREWTWDNPREPIPPDELAAVGQIDSVIGLRGRTIVDLGCGRAACSFEATARGAVHVIAVDSAPGAILATRDRLAGSSVELVLADARATGLPDNVGDLVWSHGVVEHMERDALDAYLAEAVRLSSEFVAFSAPNPLCPVYVEFVAHRLHEESWLWGFEEPLTTYAPHLRRLGCEIVFDGSVGRRWNEVSMYALNRYMPDGLPPNMPGIATLVVARVPA